MPCGTLGDGCALGLYRGPRSDAALPPLGPLLLFRLPHPGAGRSLAWTRPVRGKLRGPTSVVHLLEGSPEEADGLAVRAHLRGLRGFIRGPLRTEALRSRLPTTVGFPSDLEEWLRTLCPEVSGKIRELVLRLVGEGMDDAGAPRSGPFFSSRHERRILRQAHLPSPDGWRRLGRLVPPLLALQADGRLSQEIAAFRARYAAQSGLSQTCFRLLRLRPSTVRPWLEWEGIVRRFLEVHGPWAPR